MAKNSTARKTSKASPKTKTATKVKKPATKKAAKPADSVREALAEPPSELERREANDRRDEPIAGGDRRKVQRRRQIDPTTCEREYTDDEIQFMQAMDEYKRRNGRMFPTCSEILEVVRDMGYEKVTPAAKEEATAEPKETSTISISDDADWPVDSESELSG